MKEIQMQPFVREGAFDSKPESSNSLEEGDHKAHMDSVAEAKEHLEHLESLENNNNSNNNNNHDEESMNNNRGNDDCWGAYQPPVQEVAPQPEHFNPITGLENLGNTCYANSVFQVLRFTPGFTSGLKHVVERMEFVEAKLQEKKERDKKALDLTNRMGSTLEKPKEEGHDGEDQGGNSLKVGDDDRKTWRIVRLMRDIFVSMSDKDYRLAGAGCVAPKDLLNAVRDVNPMFEENIQQDAPEFLHCLLMYVQEASKQIFKLQDILAPPKPVLLLPADDDKMEDDQDSKSDKSDAPSTSSGYDSDPAAPLQSSEKSTGLKKSKKSTLLSKGQLRITSMFSKSGKNSAAASCSSTAPSGKTVSTKRNANGTLTRIISPQKAVGKSLLKHGSNNNHQSSSSCPTKSTSKTDATHSRSSQLHPAKRRRTGSPVRGEDEKSGGKKIQGVVPIDDSVRNKVEDYLYASARGDIVTRLFEGKMVIKTTCQNCDTVSERTEPYQDLSVPVRMEEGEDDEKRSSDSGLGSSGIGMSPSRDMGMFSDDEFVEEEPRICWPLNVLCKPERLADQNKYACDVCHAYTEAVRSTQYQQLPPILNVHLKRFSASMGNGVCGPTLTKINDYLSTPFDLPSGLTTTTNSIPDLETALHPPDTGYSLYAIIMHQGTSLSVGHYTAYIRVCHPCFPQKREAVEEDVCSEGEYALSEKSANDSSLDDDRNDGTCNGSDRLCSEDKLQKLNSSENGKTVRSNSDESRDLDGNGENYVCNNSNNNNNSADSVSAGVAMSQSLENLSLSDAKSSDNASKNQSSSSPETYVTNEEESAYSWYECDDSEITKISKEKLAYRLAPVSNGATSYATPYMLLYTRSCH